MRPPLHWVIVENKPHIVPILLRHGADPNSKGGDDLRWGMMNAQYYRMQRCVAELKKSLKLK